MDRPLWTSFEYQIYVGIFSYITTEEEYHIQYIIYQYLRNVILEVSPRSTKMQLSIYILIYIILSIVPKSIVILNSSSFEILSGHFNHMLKLK